MEKYYYEETWGTCKDKCHVKNDGTMIGSAKCKECASCIAYNDREGFIKCKDLDSALGK